MALPSGARAVKSSPAAVSIGVPSGSPVSGRTVAFPVTASWGPNSSCSPPTRVGSFDGSSCTRDGAADAKRDGLSDGVGGGGGTKGAGPGASARTESALSMSSVVGASNSCGVGAERSVDMLPVVRGRPNPVDCGPERDCAAGTGAAGAAPTGWALELNCADGNSKAGAAPFSGGGGGPGGFTSAGSGGIPVRAAIASTVENDPVGRRTAIPAVLFDIPGIFPLWARRSFSTRIFSRTGWLSALS